MFVAVVPDRSLHTHQSRGALPATVAHEDATVAALQERGWGVLAGDRFRIASPEAGREVGR